MTWQELRAKYPVFSFDNFKFSFNSNELNCSFNYSIGTDHSFTHKISISDLQVKEKSVDTLVFNLGLAEMFSYWKLTCSPQVVIRAGRLDLDQISFWHKLFLKGMGEYFYQNQIDFTPSDFLRIESHFANKPPAVMPPEPGEGAREDGFLAKNILVPLGGGKDSIVTAEILKSAGYKIRPIIVLPSSPASQKIADILGEPPLLVTRTFDPQLKVLTASGFLNGHIPYSAVLAFIFILSAAIEQIPHVAVSNEASSDEGNATYLGQVINHQYSKSLEFETDFSDYNHRLNSQVTYFSFLRPLHELQIARLFSKYPQYFSVFRSCNKNQRQDSWCGHCAKCLSIALTLTPWTSKQTIIDIIGSDPLSDPNNSELLSQMTDPNKVKPFECVTTTKEANICRKFISEGRTSAVTQFLDSWGKSLLSPEFLALLKTAYAT